MSLSKLNIIEKKLLTYFDTYKQEDYTNIFIGSALSSSIALTTKTKYHHINCKVVLVICIVFVPVILVILNLFVLVILVLVILVVLI